MFRGNKKMKLNQSKQLMAQDRETVEEAYAGDIIGIFDPGVFSIGDTICLAKHKVQFDAYSDLCSGAFLESAAEGFHEA